MRFARINTVAPEYIRYFYGKHRPLRHAPYRTQFEALMWDSYMQPDSYTHYLKELGYESLEVIANVQSLQRRWCLENGFCWDAADFVESVALEQMRRFRPEVVLMVNYRIFNEAWVRRLREQCHSVRHVMTWCGVNLETYAPLRGYDTVLTCNEYLAREMRRAGVNVTVVPFGFDQRILSRINAERPPSLELVFAGLVRRNDGFHGERARFLEQVSEEFDLTVFTDNRTPSRVERYARQALFDTARCLQQIGLGSMCRLPGLRNAARWTQRPAFPSEAPMWRRVRRGVYGLDYFQTLRDAKISLNVHPDCAGWAASNIRLFEATGVGTCLITDWKDNLGQFFEPDSEIVTFKSPTECLEKLRWLVAHPEGRKRIAEAGQQRTLKQHNYMNVARALDAIIEQAALVHG